MKVVFSTIKDPERVMDTWESNKAGSIAVPRIGDILHWYNGNNNLVYGIVETVMWESQSLVYIFYR